MTVCATCNGGGEVGVCANDGTHGCSHVNDREFPCPDCGGTGEAPEPLGDFTVTLRFHFPTAEARAAWRSENRALLERVAIEVDASVSPEQTPTPAADSAHSGDQCTDGETP